MLMKELMINLCKYIESKYEHEIKAIITNKETNMHFEVDVE